MMQNPEAACEETERSIKKLKSTRSSLPVLRVQDQAGQSASTSKQDYFETPPPPYPTNFDIFAKLREIYEDERRDTADDSDPKYNSLLLEKLVMKERLNTLVVNLYPGNKGYSLALRTAAAWSNQDFIPDDTANMIETKQWPYEEDDLLRYIDNEELPSCIVDLLEPEFGHLFYSGCIIAQVRDYRGRYPHLKCDIHHVLLRPTLKSVLTDINNIADDETDWTSDEKDQLESQILMANQPTLCLDPDSSLSGRVAEIVSSKHMFKAQKFHRMAKKFSQVFVNRKRKLDQFTYRHGLELHEFITRSRSRSRTGTSNAAEMARRSSEEIKPVPVPNLESPLLSPPSGGVVINEFKTYQRPKETSDYLPQLIEEYVLETDMPSKEKGKPRVYHIKLSILQRPSNSEYLGELYLDRDHKKNEQNGVACRFSLGSRANATRYIHQFTEIFTESGRKSARICYGLSPGYKERVAMAQAQQQQQSSVLNQQNLAQKNAASQQHQANLVQQHLNQLNQSIQNQQHCVTVSQPGVNGSVVGLGVTTSQNVPILQSHLQGIAQPEMQTQAMSNQKQAISALATKLMNSAQQYQAAASAKQQQQKLTTANNAAIINLLNSTPASNANSDAGTAVANAINSGSLLPPHQLQTIGQKLLARKMTLPSNARVLNHHGNLIALNNSRLQELQQQQQQQTVTLTSVNAANYANFTLPLKQQRIINTTTNDSGKSALSALLVGTPAADRPDIVGHNTSSLLLEKLGGVTGPPVSAISQQIGGSTTAGSSHFVQKSSMGNVTQPVGTAYVQTSKGTGQQQYVVQSGPKATTVLSPMSSPPAAQGNTINVQSLNFAQLQSIPGLQNLQVQLPGFAQPISLSLNVSSAGSGTVQGHQGTTGLIVSLPTTQTSNASTQAVGSIGGTVAPQTVVLNASTSSLAQLVGSGVKAIPQQALRNSTNPQTVSVAQGGQPFQLITPLTRPRVQQQGSSPQHQQQQITPRTLQRTTPITIKMAAPTNTNQLQKQAQYQQICLNQPGGLVNRRRSNATDQQ